MNSARSGRLRLGDRVRFQERTYTVVGLTGMRVRLADTHGVGMLVDRRRATATATHQISPTEPVECPSCCTTITGVAA